MKELIFRCKLNSDIVLNASGASEGRLPSHDFIPGSNFLGIVAKRYGDAKNNKMAYDLFHSSNVRFGDAHIVIRDKRSRKVPASWFYSKGEKLEDNVWLHHKLDDSNCDKLIFKRIQLKQAREGFFVDTDKGFELVDLADSKQYSMKSAYSSEKRRSADSQLFGYTALQPGSIWEFSVSVAEDEKELKFINFIKNNLQDDRHIGRSRSAQYGLVNITFVGDSQDEEQLREYSAKDEITIYADSRLSFFDKYGQPTLQPTSEMLKLPPDSQILWKKSQIITSRYAPWNGIRRTQDADRICIDKGSVFVVRLAADKELANKISGLGIYKNEGFGEVLVEPNFLQTNNADGSMSSRLFFDKEDIEKVELAVTKKDSANKPALVQWLIKKADTNCDNQWILYLVNSFIDQHAGIYAGSFASQWGAIRALAGQEKNTVDLMDRLFASETGYLMHGVAQDKWKKKDRRGILQKFLVDTQELYPEIIVPLIIKLATEMPKAVRSQDSKEGK